MGKKGEEGKGKAYIVVVGEVWEGVFGGHFVKFGELCYVAVG